MLTYKYKLASSVELDDLNAASASVWNECLKLKEMWNYAHGYRTTSKACELWMDKKLCKTQPLHSQSIQSVRERYFKSWQGFFGLRRNGDTTSKPPHKLKKHVTTVWKKSAIRIKGKLLILSNGRSNKPLEVKLSKHIDISDIALIELVYDTGQYQLHFVYKTAEAEQVVSADVMGVDVGEIHPIVCCDGVNTTIFNGRYIRSLYRLRNKVLASMDSSIAKCARGSKRFWYFVRRKWKRIRKLDNQIKDCLHKHTTKFVELCEAKNIGTIVMGDLTGIRENINYGKRANQKLHQWAFGKIAQLITYKAKSVGITVKKIDEAYTSQTCPQCANRKKPTTREYKCKCGFSNHRDGVGALNIRKKYLGCFGNPVAVSMATPVGRRLEVQCCPASAGNLDTIKERTPSL